MSFSIPPFTIPNTFSPDTYAYAELVDANFTAIADILNALGYVLSLPTASASANTTLLTNAFTVLADGGGGITAQPDDTTFQGSGGKLIIPQYQYQMDSSTDGLTIPNQTVIEAAGFGGSKYGSSSANPFYHFIINGSGSAGNDGNIFLNLSGTHTVSGNKIERIGFKWLNSTNPTDVCLLLGIWSATVEDCSFYSVPVIASFGQTPTGGGSTPGGLSCALIRPKSRYNSASSDPDYVTHIWMSGEQGVVTGPGEFLCDNPLVSGVCIGMGGGAAGSEHQIIEGIHVTDWTYCVDYADINNTGIGSGTLHTTFRDNQFFGLITAINGSSRAGGTGGAAIYDQKYFGNTITKSRTSTSAAPIFLIDTNSGPNSSSTPWLLVGNTIFSSVTSTAGGIAQANQYGVQINGGNARLIGNSIGLVGSNNGSVTGCSNIAITSSYTFPYFGFGTSGYPAVGLPPTTGTSLTSTTTGPSSCVIEGNDLRPQFPGVNHGQPTGGNGAGPSNLAIVISGTQSGNIQIRGNDMTGYSSPGPLSVTATITGTLEVTDNPGYNDQNTTISTVIPTSAVNAMTAATLGGGSINYFGPSNVVFQNNNSSGTTTVHLGPGSYVVPIGAIFDRNLGNNSDNWYVVCSGGATTADLIEYVWVGK